MTAHRASLLNAATLLACSLWAFFSLDKTSYTALIPAVFGAALLLCAPALKAEKTWAAILCTLLSAIILAALYVPLQSALEDPASIGLLRISAMIVTSLLALVFLAKLLIARLSSSSF